VGTGSCGSPRFSAVCSASPGLFRPCCRDWSGTSLPGSRRAASRLDFYCWPLGIPLDGATKLNGTRAVTFQQSVADLTFGSLPQEPCRSTNWFDHPMAARQSARRPNLELLQPVCTRLLYSADCALSSGISPRGNVAAIGDWETVALPPYSNKGAARCRSETGFPRHSL